MKTKILSMMLGAALCLSLAACAQTGQTGSAGASAAPEAAASSAPPVSSAQETAPAAFADGVLTLDDYTITITDYKVIRPGEEGNEYGEKPVIAFWYDTTNTGEEADVDPSTAWIFVFEAVQDNDPNAVNTLNMGMLPDDRFLDSQMQDIKPGGTVSNAVAYELDDETTPVTLTASDILGSEYGSQTFEITQ